ncbi:5-carboxymethyl-2-hydroxymuconate Delta-isomerase [Simplicispira suum]|jgi:5-carboxymethyl-2-hydroxymuconate isomerase|uniref:5-carboxymethyl-2-hydroxymuconate isomerase n=1 Tax=Simplicispira suum TaxID=2109915 RepID=A0A2S0MWT2_9BURK|nr:5-carboxymethyl-2-hydroxymuconate Delta-isomerase [Simplicispira suum]AVO40342.1 5-carboxymethyl-2-hydroxymuconate isomerase [Simplicispira suum]MBW7833395.1 5-carboxymethyl-2-hydroxymuconate Delta-isomerase [Simplicispira suum]MCB1978536.1 5-carboxymethyl-2-hydroxymuconate Delta-isomerase [Burkholderiaceae bacterium]MCO5105281.1 5-carboxymethyl-2-hydroxymuconate Delta-isomerase [Burkholderiaceae bacterium]
MPHLIVEYSANLAPFPERKTLVELNEAVCASPEVQTEADLKTRFISQNSFAVGTESSPRGFVHAQLRLLAGRTPDAKADLAERVAAVLRRRTPQPEGMLVQLSVEIVDMDRPSYVKERL